MKKEVNKEIPKGLYCYKIDSMNYNTGAIKTIPCPYYKSFGRELEGYCKMLDTEILDQCKECDINRD